MGFAVPRSTKIPKVRTRVSAPKVRSGCINCKRRRVKCDEQKPNCLRCMNRGLVCEGYQAPRAWLFEPFAEKNNNREIDDNAMVKASPESPTGIPLHAFTAEEGKWLAFYANKTGQLISQFCHSRFDFFVDTLVQTAHDNVGLRNMLVATAMFDSIHEIDVQGAQIESAFLNHHIAAIRSVTSTRPTVDIVLMMCMASYVLESYRGNIKNAVIHLISARKIVEEYLSHTHRQDDPVVALIKDHILPILSDALIYASVMPLPPPVTSEQFDLSTDHWRALPRSITYTYAEDAEHTIVASVLNQLRLTGQTPYALIRARSVLKQWRRDFAVCETNIDPKQRDSILAVHNIGNLIIDARDHTMDEDMKRQTTDGLLAAMKCILDTRRPHSLKVVKPLTQFVRGLSTDQSHHTLLEEIESRIQILSLSS